MRSTSSYGATGTSSPALVSTSRPGRGAPSVTPIAASSSPMIDTSTRSGTLVELVHAVGEQAGRHQLEHRVLGAGHVDPSGQRPAVLDADRSARGGGERSVKASSPVRASERQRASGLGRWPDRTADRCTIVQPRSWRSPAACTGERVASAGSLAPLAHRPTSMLRPCSRADQRPPAAPACTPSSGGGRPRRPPPRPAPRTTSSPSGRDDGTAFEQVLGPFSEYERHGASGAGRPRAGRDDPVRLRDPVVRVAVRAAGALDAARGAATTPTHRSRHRGHAVVGAARPAHAAATCSCSVCSPPASMSSAFVNTLFTQTVSFAGDDFGVSDSARRRRRLARARRHRAGAARSPPSPTAAGGARSWSPSPWRPRW